MTLLGLTFEQLREKMRPLPEAHTRTLWRAMHRELSENLLDRPDFTPPLQRWLAENRSLIAPPLVADQETASADGFTRKVLLRLDDGERIETVLMAYPGRHTACLSTQVGCAMGCVFCATGQMGFTRHLRSAEIVAQVLHVQRLLRKNGESGLRNLVLMGMGEPLHNYESVITALQILSDTRGANIGPSRISISTVGVVPGIVRLAEENQPYHLAVSLHGATQEARARLVPVARKWPLDQLLEACHFYCEKTGRRIFFEWTLIENENDSPAQAEILAEVLQGLDAHLNLIPLNRTSGYAGLPSVQAIRFKEIIRQAGFPCTIRQKRGLDVAAGCGQLAVAA